MKFTDSIYRGEVVLWYKNANISRKPMIALVLDSYSGGTCDLLMLETRETVLSVRHRGDEYVQMRNGVMSEGAKETGCWEFRSDKQKKEFWPDFFKKPKAE